MKKNGYFISYLTKNRFVLYFSTKKKMVGNEIFFFILYEW